MKNIEQRLQALESEILPGPPVLVFELHVRMEGKDNEIVRITNFQNSSEPSPSGRTWIRNPGESYEAFRNRSRSDILDDLHPGPQTAFFYEHTKEAENVPNKTHPIT